MKTRVIIALPVALCFLMTSCEKTVVVNNEIDSVEEAQNDLSRPLEFSSRESLLDAVKSFDYDASATRSIVTGFVSYYDTVMQEDDYDERPNAIFSDAFGSILNPDGEVICDGTFFKLGLNGIYYGPLDETDNIRLLAECEELDIDSFDKVLVGDNEEYRSRNYPSVCFSDTFGLFSESQTLDSDMVATRSVMATYSDPAAGVIWGDVGHKNGRDMDQDYTWPKGSDQKTKFSSKVANDTKIYKQHYAGLYDESGVKTKTMRKKGIFWNKFTADVTSAVTNVLICEAAADFKNNPPYGWFDVSKTHYKGETFMIATKVVPSYIGLPINSKAVENECNEALKWAKENGADISEVEGVRYIVTSDNNTSPVLLKDIVVKKHAAKNTLIFNLLTYGGTFYIDKGIVNGFRTKNAQYHVDFVVYYGFSEYEGEKKGFKLICGRNLK